jgi:hypothetical protein
LLYINVYLNILTMHEPIKFKSPNNISKWQMGFNSAFKGLMQGLMTTINLGKFDILSLTFKNRTSYT